MRSRLDRIPALVIALFLALAMASCSDSTSPEGAVHETTSPPITLPMGPAAPFSRIEVSGLPSYDEAYFAEILDPDGVALGPALIELGESNEILITVPPHPDTPMQGGMVLVRVTDGAQLASQAAALEIAALPPHPGALARMVAALREILDAQLTINGTSREVLRATPAADLRDEDISLFAVQSFLDDPENENSLLALSNGPIPLFQDSDLDIDLVDSVIGSSGLDTYFAAAAESLQDDSAKRSKSIGLVITNMTELDAAMNEAASYNRLISDNAGQVLNDVGLALGVVGVFSGGSTAVIGGGLWAFQKVAEVGANLLPSKFDNNATTVDLAVTEFYEDDPGPGFWIDFSVVAMSEGMSLDTLVLETILQGAGFGTKFGDFIETFGGEIAQEMAAFVITEATNAVINEAGENSEIITIPPQSWSLVSTGDPLTQARIVQGAAVDVTGPTTYEPREVGESSMWVETLPGHFGGQAAVRTNTVSVRGIEITITPSAATVEPGQSIDFTAEVQYALDETLEWTTTQGSLTTTSNSTATLVTPAEAWDDPIVVKATSKATGGLRVSGVPERSGRALVASRSGLILIEPSSLCLDVNTTQTFAATILGFPPEQQGVTWTAERGSFDGDTYTAPSTPGPDTITATSVADPELTASARIDVATCSCFWTIQYSGGRTGAFSGSEAEVFHIPGALTTIECFPATDDSSPPNFFVTVFPSLDSGQTGSFEVLAGFVDASGLSFVNSEDATTVLDLASNNGNTYEGTVSGSLVTPDPDNPESLLTISISVSFRGALGFGSGGEGCSGE